MSKYGELIGECILKPVRPPAKRAWWELFFSRRPLFVLVSSFTFIDPRGRKWECRKGGETNGMSIPWWLLWLIPAVTGRSVVAFVVHDVACEKRRFSRAVTAYGFWCVLRWDNVHPIRAWLAWLGVRYGGPRF